ncbi:phosphoribosyltransferase [Peribacillus alkalitolerans]|uniref:phosphoribosyltransferase n=1 Tax=Peribacillus alkalitolerans TaxID=1550385 RepID=UPI0013CFB37A|nr:phosphoribosyltransferase [Peribacillus alkalitolerans]
MSNREPIYLGYDEIASKIEKHVMEIKSLNYNAIIVILRGGSFAGMHLSFLTDLPVYFVNYDRSTREVNWNGHRPKSNSKVLVVEDFAGKGSTLVDTINFLTESNFHVHTFVVCKDLLSQIQNPDYYCFNLTDKNYRLIVPWEKHEYDQGLI